MSEKNVKKARGKANAIVFTALVIASLVCVNLLGTRLFGRLDLTEDKVYTLSPASRDLVAKLPDKVVAKAFLSKEDTPPQVNQVVKYLRDMLDEYKSASKGKFEWEAIDPATAKSEEERKKLEEEAARLGIQKIHLQQLSKEKVSLGSIYLGVAFQYGDKSERLPLVKLEGLEYEISSLLKRLTVKKRKVGFAQGHGEPDAQQGQFVWNVLEQNYDVVPVALGGDKPAAIPDDVDVLIVFGPKQVYSDEARKAIDAFLMKGRSAAFLVDGMTLDSPRGQIPPEMQARMPEMARKNEVGLEPLLGAYGFRIGEDVIMDQQSARGVVQVQGQFHLVNQPYFPIATRLAPHDATEKLRGMIFPMASSVEVQGPMKEAADKKSGELVALAQSTERSWKQTGFFMMDPLQEIKPGNERGPFAFGYAYKGSLKSAFPSAAPDANMSTPAQGAKAPPGQNNVRLVVIGDSDFAADRFMQSREFQELNGHFFQNIVDWLAQDETLTPVRSKGVTQRPPEVKSEATPTVVKSLNMFGLPLAFIGYGLVRWRRRASRRQRS